MFFKKKDIHYYLEKIDQEYAKPDSKIDEILVENLFIEMSEVASESDVKHLHRYLHGNIDEYSDRKYYSLWVVGDFCGSSFQENIEEFTKSNDPRIAEEAFDALCRMYIRKKLDAKKNNEIEKYLVSVVKGHNLAAEDVIFCASTLLLAGYRDSESILEHLKKEKPELVSDVLGFLK